MTKEVMKQALCVYLDAFENHLITNATSSNLDMTGHIAELARTAIEQAEEQDESMAERWRESASDYERGVIDGRQMQAQSSVDNAVNAMLQRTWVGLTDEEITELRLETFDAWATNYEVYKVIEAKLREKNDV